MEANTQLLKKHRAMCPQDAKAVETLPVSNTSGAREESKDKVHVRASRVPKGTWRDLWMPTDISAAFIAFGSSAGSLQKQ